MNNHDFPPSFKCMFSSIKYLSWDQCRKLYTAIEITHNIFEVIRDKTRFENKDYVLLSSSVQDAKTPFKWLPFTLVKSVVCLLGECVHMFCTEWIAPFQVRLPNLHKHTAAVAVVEFITFLVLYFE